jgi:hypothetical protein
MHKCPPKVLIRLSHWKDDYWKTRIPLVVHPDFDERSYFDRQFIYLTEYWEKEVPEDVFKIIPHSSNVSLAISALIQHASKPHDKPIGIYTLLYSFEHDDLIIFCRYLFTHPHVMQIVYRDYFKLKKIELKSGGEAVYTGNKFLYAFLSKLSQFHQTPKIEEQNKKILDAFSERIIPLAADQLPHQKRRVISVHQTTIYVDVNTETHAFKFKRPEESWGTFSIEPSVTKAFNELQKQFKSHFAKPLGSYAITDLPVEANYLKDQLGQGPYYVHHYQVSALQVQSVLNLPYEDFLKTQRMIHIDIGKMIVKGVYPILNAYFKQKDDRDGNLIILRDLARRLSRSSVYFNKRGGRMMRNPLLLSATNNTRQSGLINLSEAYTDRGSSEIRELSHILDCLYGKKEPSHLILEKMIALNIALLNGMIQFVLFFKEQQDFHFENDERMKVFADYLKGTFCDIGVGYTEINPNEMRAFAENPEINWIMMAQQITFWADTSERGHRSYLEKGTYPSFIYKPTTKVTVEKPNGFYPHHLGYPDGPLALAEFENLSSLMFMFVMLREPLEKDAPKLSS